MFPTEKQPGFFEKPGCLVHVEFVRAAFSSNDRSHAFLTLQFDRIGYTSSMAKSSNTVVERAPLEPAAPASRPAARDLCTVDASSTEAATVNPHEFYGTAAFREALIRHFYRAKRAAISRASRRNEPSSNGAR